VRNAELPPDAKSTTLDFTLLGMARHVKLSARSFCEKLGYEAFGQLDYSPTTTGILCRSG